MVKCPKCGREFDRLLALSRRDSTTMICDDCGTQEALEDYEMFERFRGSKKGADNDET
ncbi:MAG: hypothetical protein IJ192_13190 [Clostridia bacterium]|nr:hypothetical protein [Clostridia bacterium]